MDIVRPQVVVHHAKAKNLDFGQSNAKIPKVAITVKCFLKPLIQRLAEAPVGRFTLQAPSHVGTLLMFSTAPHPEPDPDLARVKRRPFSSYTGLRKPCNSMARARLTQAAVVASSAVG